MKFEVITKQTSDVISENFKILTAKYYDDGTEGICLQNDLSEEFELKVEWIDELIQALIIYKEHNIVGKKQLNKSVSFGEDEE